MRQYLEQQADAIEQVLKGNGLAARVAGGSLSPRLIHYHLELPPNVKLSQLTSLLPAIAEQTGVAAIRLARDIDSGLPTIELPRPDPSPVQLLPLARSVASAAPACTATLGLDTNGSPLLLRIDGPEVGSVLVSGQGDTGKTEMLKTIALSLALHNGPDTLRMLLIDLDSRKRRGAWAGFEALPHLVSQPIRDQQDAILQLSWVSRVINNRAERRDEGRPVEGSNLVVIVDGLEAALNGPMSRQIESTLWKIAAEGNPLGVHLVCASATARKLEQWPWGARLVGKCVDGREAKSASGVSSSGAEGLLGDGDFLALLGGHVIRFQAAAASREEITQVVNTLRACADEQANDRPARTTNQQMIIAGAARAKSSAISNWTKTGTNG